ncbi:MAG: chemotaxis protein CheX [Candidatus Omnitrophota bacterium]
MNNNYINPFVESVCDFFSTMLGSEVKRGDIRLTRRQPVGAREIAVKIQFAGTTNGILVFFLPAATAIEVAHRFIGLDMETVDDCVLDAVSEFANIVAGGAKSRIQAGLNGPPLDLSLPEIIRDSHNFTQILSRSAWLEVPFASEIGPFEILIHLEMNNRKRRNDESVDC